MESSLKGLQDTIGYKFTDESLLYVAMTHSSYANEQRMKKTKNNERLEFLGDAVLEIAVSKFLYLNFPEMSEGEMSKLRASLVCEPTLALDCKEINLSKYIMLSHGEDMTGGRERKSILSDAFGALIGAIYLDGGYDKAAEFIDKYVLTDIEHKQLFHDSKTKLQEVVQAEYKQKLEYRLINESGPDHAKEYSVQAFVGDKALGEGTASTKKGAEQEAAYNSLLMLKK